MVIDATEKCLQLKVPAEQKEKLFLPEKKTGTCFQTSSAQHVADITTWCLSMSSTTAPEATPVGQPITGMCSGAGAERRTHRFMACDMNSVFRSYQLDLE